MDAGPGSMIYPLEDPYISRIRDQLVMGGTHVRMKQGRLETYYAYFYRGTDIHNLKICFWGEIDRQYGLYRTPNFA